MHKLHRLLVNPVIPVKYASEADRVADIPSPEFEAWLVQDQTLFTWLLSILSDGVLPRVLNCHHSWEVWERIQQHYFAHLKAKVRQIRNELKNTKKGSKTISEFITKIHNLADSLTAIGETILDSYLTDVLLDGLPEEYNPFVMMIFGKPDTPPLSEIESLLVQEFQLEKIRQELSIATANIAQALVPNHQNQAFHNQYHRNNNASNSNSRSRGHQGRSRGRARGASTGNRITCQLCSRNGHSVLDCWFRFDETFVPPPNVVQGLSNTANTTNVVVAPNALQSSTDAHNFATPTVNLAETLPMDATGTSFFTCSCNCTGDDEYWYGDTGASHNVTPNRCNLHHSCPYHGKTSVTMGNGSCAKISAIGFSSFTSPLYPHISLVLNKLLHVPNVKKDMLCVSQFTRDNNVVFEFHSPYCLVKCQDSKKVLLVGKLESDGLYVFKGLPIAKCNKAILNSVSSCMNKASNPTIHSVIASPNVDSLWHARLGHANAQAVSHVMKSCNMKSSNKNSLIFCTACQLGKSH